MSTGTKRSPRFCVGFTLMGLLLVIAIIAILTALLLPAFGGAKEQVQAHSLHQQPEVNRADLGDVCRRLP